MPPFLEVQNLQVSYGRARVVRGVSLEVAAGECVALVGANGAGKTSIIRSIMGLTPATGGRVLINGADVTGAPPWKRASAGIGYMPEGRRIFSNLNVERNLLVGAYQVRDQTRVRTSLERIYGIFPRLRERQSQFGSTLSGGEQQMLAIGRALMSDPRLLIIDEVSMGLAPVLVSQAFQLITRLHVEGLTILLVEQNAKKALQVAERGYLLESGRVVLSGTASDLSGHPDFVGTYFGRTCTTGAE